MRIFFQEICKNNAMSWAIAMPPHPLLHPFVRVKSISESDSGSQNRLHGEFMYHQFQDNCFYRYLYKMNIDQNMLDSFDAFNTCCTKRRNYLLLKIPV